MSLSFVERIVPLCNHIPLYHLIKELSSIFFHYALHNVLIRMQFHIEYHGCYSYSTKLMWKNAKKIPTSL